MKGELRHAAGPLAGTHKSRLSRDSEIREAPGKHGPARHRNLNRKGRWNVGKSRAPVLPEAASSFRVSDACLGPQAR
jgi:hypothetical protein